MSIKKEKPVEMKNVLNKKDIKILEGLILGDLANGIRLHVGKLVLGYHETKGYPISATSKALFSLQDKGKVCFDDESVYTA